MNDDFDNARTDREMLARYAVLADPDRIRTTVRDALNVHADRQDDEAASSRWAGSEHESARAWMREQHQLALAGPRWRDSRARMRGRRQLCLALEETIDGIDPALLAKFLLIGEPRLGPCA